MKSLTGALARGVIRARFALATGWVVAAVACALLLPSLQEAQTNSIGDLVATDAEAIDTEVRSAELFKFPLLSRTVVVQRDPDGLSPAELGRAARDITRVNLGTVPGLESVGFALGVTNVLGRPPFSREASTTALTYLFFPPDIGPIGRTGLAHLFIDRLLPKRHGTYIGVTGAAPARAERIDVISENLPLFELATIVVVCLAIGIHFRAIGAPFVNLVAIGITYFVAVHSVAAIGSAIGVVVPSEVEPVMVALVFGIVTDYSIFFLSRFAGRVAGGESERQGAEKTTAELLPIIGVAGLTVAAATATLVLARLGFFQAFGPGLALSVLVALAVAMTFIPAMLAIFGGRLFWPHRPNREGGGRPRAAQDLRARLARIRLAILMWPTRRPLVVVIATVIPLLALAAGLLHLKVGNRVITSLPNGSEPKVAYREASRGFAAGILSPTVVVVEAPGVTDRRAALARLQTLLSGRAGVAAVVGPRQAPFDLDLGAVRSSTGDAVRYFVVLNMDPFGSRAIDSVQDLNDELPGYLRQAGIAGAKASLAGDTALSAETVTKSSTDLARVVPAATLVVFIILCLFLLALVAPLYLVLTSLLALGASLGLTVFVFQDLLGHGELVFYVPFAASVLLVALGSDYNVYLVGRVWSEARRRPLRQAVAVAGSRAASAITVAGLVLAVSFAMLAIVPLQSFREISFAVSAGVLIDAFVVRSLLAPALITLVGKTSGWPGKRLAQRMRPHSKGKAG